MDAVLAVDFGYVGADSAVADAEITGDLFVLPAQEEAVEDLLAAFGRGAAELAGGGLFSLVV